MKKSICMLGCAMLGVLVACSTDSASKPADPALVAAAEAAVITESEPLTAQIQQQFGRELRILNDNNMKRETIKDADGSMWYCQGVYNEDLPGKPAILVFLHGIGERGNENLASIRLAVPDIVKQIKDAKQKVILIAPECPSNQLWAPLHRGGTGAKLTEKPAQALGLVPVLIQKKIKEFDADPDRVYITGLSMGGYGTWDLISRYGTDLFAAAMPCCGGGDPAQAEKMKDLPIWIFHGGADPTVPVMLSRRMYAALKEAGNDDVFYKEYPGVQHDCWTQTYQNPESWKWLFSQKRGVKSDIRPEQGEVVKVTQEEFESAGGFGGGRGGGRGGQGGQRPAGQGQGGQRPAAQGMGQGGQRPAGQGMGQGGQRPAGQGQGGFGGGQGGQRPAGQGQGGFGGGQGMGQGGFGGGMGQGGQRPTGQGMGQGGQRPTGQGQGFGGGQGMGQGGFGGGMGQGGQRPAGQGQGGQRPAGQGQGGFGGGAPAGGAPAGGMGGFGGGMGGFGGGAPAGGMGGFAGGMGGFGGGMGGFGGGMGGFGGGMGGMPGGQAQGGPRATVNTVSEIQEKYPDEYKAAQALRQSDPAAYRAKLRDLQQKLTGSN